MQRILERAIEIDAQDVYSAADIQEVAAELGVQESAVKRAIAEHGGGLPTISEPQPSRSALFAAGGVVLGVPVALGVLPLLPAALLAEATSLIVAMSSRGTSAYRTFIKRNIALWAGVAFGPLGWIGAIPITVTGLVAAVSTGLGSAAMAVRDQVDDLTDSALGQGPSGSGIHSPGDRLLAFLREPFRNRRSIGDGQPDRFDQQ